MLVLSRKIGEKLVLEVPPSETPTTIEVTLIRARVGSARLGLQAPLDVDIVRDELLEQQPASAA